MTKSSVRVVECEDPSTIAGLRRRWDTEEAASADDEFETRFAHWFEAERDRRIFLVASVDDVVVGMVNLVIFERMPAFGRVTGRWGYLSNMYVVAEHRGRGIGQALLEELTRRAKELELERIVLNPTERSKPLYARHGFEPVGDRLLVRT